MPTALANSLALRHLPLDGVVADGDPVPDYISRWTFDDADTDSSTATDIGSGGHDIALTSAPTSATGVVNEAREFDGTNDYGTLTEDSDFDWITTSVFSISLWVNSDVDYDNQQGIFSKYTSDSNRQYLLHTTTTDKLEFRFYTSNSPTGVVSAASMSLGVWYHIVVTYDGSGNLAMYKDGSLVDSDTGATASSITADTNIAWWNRASSSRRFNGKLDDLRIYDRVLPTDDIDALNALGSP